MNENKGKVLVVDDDNLGRTIISTIVAKLGYLVDQAESGRKALEMVRDGAYDCILLDLVMPEMDGFEVLLQLKQDPESMHVPVIVISGNDDLVSASRSIGMGAIDYIQKPVNAILLNARLQTSLAEKRIRDLEKQHLKEMRMAQARMVAVIGDSPLGIIMLDLNMVVKEVNPTFMKMMRATEERSLLGPIERYCAGLDHTCKMEMASYLSGEADGSFCKEATMLRLDGTTYDVQMTMSMVQAEGDSDAFAVAMVQDITERKRIETELKESEEFHRLLMSNISSGVVIIDPKTRRIESVNDAAAAMFGDLKENIEGHRCHSFLCPALEKACPVCDLGQKMDNAERVMLCADGSKRHILKTVQRTDIQGKEKLLECFVDITERKIAEEELIRNKAEIDRQNNLLSSLIKTLPVGIFMIEAPSGKPLLANEMALQILGRGILPDAGENNLSEVYEAYKLSTNALYPNNELPSILGMKGISAHVDDMLVVHPDGTHRQLEIFGSPVTDNEGNVWASLVNFTDITERKRSEGALLMANRKLNLLNSITRHDIVNQTVVLDGYIELMRKRYPDERIAGTLDRMHLVTENISKQISFTKDYQDLGMQAAEWSNVCKTFRSSFNLLGPIGVEIETNAGFEILADRLLQKVFYNLMDNSIRHGEYVTKIQLDCTEGADGLKVVYRDNGCGVADKDRPHLFEKGFGKNTGLGLFLTKEILSITKINIIENGRYGEGARFEMNVPEGAYRKA